MSCDLIVIGAGPAGCATSLIAARAGMRVTLIERRRLPRHKTCGGGVPLTVAGELGLDLPALGAECHVVRMRHTWRFGEAVTGQIAGGDVRDKVGLWCVRRERFDHALAQAAVEAGASLYEGFTVDAIECGADAVMVRAAPDAGGARWSKRARHVVVCDGATGRGARLVGLRPAHTHALAMEAQVPHVWGGGNAELDACTIHLEHGAVRNGYAWAFPNSDQLNIGAGFFRDADAVRGSDVRDTLTRAMREFTGSLGIAGNWHRAQIRAHPLPIWAGRNELHTPDGRVLLAGDAAALVNPLFGDGILNAVRSGRIAAECIVAGSPERYTGRINEELGTELEAAAHLARVFYRLPRQCYRLVIRRKGASAIAAGLLCGVLSYRNVAPRAMRRLAGTTLSGQALR